MIYYRRQLESCIQHEKDFYPAILLTGPRQVGKSTLLLHLKEDDRTYVSLDDPRVRNLAVYQPELFFERYKPPLFIDEIQYAPGLFPYIKIWIDKRGENNLFWLTGSQIFPLMKGGQESLAGRVRILQLAGFSRKEGEGEEQLPFPRPIGEMMQEKVEAFSVNETLIKGTMPRVLLQEGIDIQGYYQSYLDTYLSRDVRDITNVLDTGLFLRFIGLLASRIAQELNLAAMGRELGIDSTTVRRWLNVLITSGLVVELPAWHKNRGKRLVKRPKIYFTDTGLAAYLLGIGRTEALENSPFSGPLFENWVITEIIKSNQHQGIQPRLYYYRDSNQREIDLIMEKDDKIYPIEIKRSGNPAHASRHFSVLEAEEDHIPYYGILCPTDGLNPLQEKVWKIPVSLI